MFLCCNLRHAYPSILHQLTKSVQKPLKVSFWHQGYDLKTETNECICCKLGYAIYQMITRMAVLTTQDLIPDKGKLDAKWRPRPHYVDVYQIFKQAQSHNLNIHKPQSLVGWCDVTIMSCFILYA